MILFNNKVVEFGQFPNGESYLKKIKPDPQAIRNVVTLKYENDGDLFRLLILKEHLFNLDIQPVLRITYVPYSRMDRENDSYAFSLKTFTDFINHMDWKEVIIYEPHSDVTPALLRWCRVINVIPKIVPLVAKELLGFFQEPYQVFFPDAGAQKRYADAFGVTGLVGFKTRDFETGRIKDLRIIGNRESDTVIIVDDLCSKGGTFVLAAQQLRSLGFKNIILVVAHCEKTIFEGEVFNHIDKIVTTDSILSDAHNGVKGGKLKVIPLTEFGV